MILVVTGANGFVGRNAIRYFAARYPTVVALSGRPAPDVLPANVRWHILDEPGWDNLAATLAGSDAILHLVGHSPRPDHASQDATSASYRVNVGLTHKLALAAAQCRVRRLVYLSTAKVFGEGGEGTVYRAATEPRPQGLYGWTKLVAEERLRQLCEDNGVEWVIARPPMVYGPGSARSNIDLFAAAVRRGIPLPVPLSANKRSLVYIDNLLDALDQCLTKQVAAGKIFMPADESPLSTMQIAQLLGVAVGRSPRLARLPNTMLRVGLNLAGRSDVADKLLNSFELDSAPNMAELHWPPRHTTANAFVATYGPRRESL
jgi:nucleoside-diphosphate-sugar epimerase